MKTIPVSIAGPSELNRSSMLSRQYAQNIYLGKGREGEHRWVAYDFPGQKAFYTGTGADRGMVVFLGEIYKVSGTSLVSINSSGTATVRGVVPGSGQCIFGPIRDDSLNDIGLIIATNGQRYYYNQSTVSLMTDADLTTGNSVAVLNNVAVFDCADDVIVHSTAGLPTTVSAFFAEANTFTDLLVRVYAFNGLIYSFGQKSGEIWAYNGATTEFIFTRQEQATFTIGLGAVYSLASDEIYMFFLGDDRRFYRLRGSLPESITTPGVANELAAMTTLSDCKAWCFKLGEQSFYWVTFPTEGKTFLYSSTYNYWVNLAHGTDSENPARHLANSYVYCYDKHYVADYRNGNVYELDLNTFTDAGETRLRAIVMSPMTGAQIGLPGRMITMGRLQLEMEVGVGLATGQGSDPQLMMEASNDGGKTYGPQQFVSMGEMGDYTANPKFDYFTTGRNIVLRILCSDPVYLSIHGGFADVADGGY